ncbi:MAG: hypothetical protein ACFFD1_01045 [Candidatus Thorarchaeota archaeon]
MRKYKSLRFVDLRTPSRTEEYKHSEFGLCPECGVEVFISSYMSFSGPRDIRCGEGHVVFRCYEVMVTEEVIEGQVEPPNRLVVIGWKGTRTAYLNLDREIAIIRYLADNPEEAGDINREGFVQEFLFEDKFATYDAWSLE